MSRRARLIAALVLAVGCVALAVLVRVLSGTAFWIAFGGGVSAALACGLAGLYFQRKGL